VRINDEEVAVSVSVGSATVSSATTFTAPFNGVYPSGIYGSNSGAAYTLNLPNSYVYAVCGDGSQNLHSPMVAYSESGSTLTFKHLTAAIGVQVVNYYGFTVAVDSIVVTSDSYRLAGAVSLTLNGSDPEVSPVASSDAAERRVKMTFDGGAALQVFAGDSTVVQVPVLPVGAGNKFSVKICVHKVDQSAVAKAIEKTQSVGGSLGRSYLAYARLATPGLFSVAANKKVIISQGNLQYQASTGKWRFATKQYTSIINAPGNNVFGDTRKTQEEWIDLFGWGTSGWNNGNSHYMPYDYEYNSGSSSWGYTYGPAKNSYTYSFDLTGDYANSDWGVYNAIMNGGNMPGLWRTMSGGSGNEYQYLLDSRSASTVNGISNARFAKATVSGVRGLIIIPDEYLHPDGVTAISNINETGATGMSKNIYDENMWVKIEASGAIFLPYTGRRSSSEVTNITAGMYWSSSNQATKAFKLNFASSTLEWNVSDNRYFGCAVRLVHDIN
jgi:hypothetical protein